VDASDAGADGSADPVIEVPGCACQSSPSRDQRGLWLALGVVLLAIRRRRPMIR
jgi:MYXO-CTERM domain-containing protein